MSLTENTSLSVINEEDRKNKFISSILFSRATIFHPSIRLTPSMVNKMHQIVELGGPDPKHPLESVHINSYGKDYRVDLHVNYLLQGHRDILETLLAFGKTIRLDDDSYEAGKKFTWSKVFETIDEGKLSSSQNPVFSDVLDSDATVLSMSMYDLAMQMGMTTSRQNYDQIEKRITQLSTASLAVNELNDEGQILSTKNVSFISKYCFYCDESKFKATSSSDKSRTNHVFIVPSPELLESIRDHGYFYRLEQKKMGNYSKASVRSFLKYSTTHKSSYLHNKTLDWLIKKYIQSIASETSKSFKWDLKKDLLASAEQIELDFGLHFETSENTKEVKIKYVGE
ncbi:hypothetical protein CTH30272_03072 [Allocatenococcus thiocycli]|nr:hypothetical protein CTH30272_03072 [Catenococcus thiocycli]